MICMRGLISVSDMVVMALAAAVCFLPGAHFLVSQCFSAVLSANLAFFLWRLVRPSVALRPAYRAAK